MKLSIVCLSLALAAGCTTVPHKPEGTPPPPPAEPALSTAVDPWARSVPATPVAPAEPTPPMTTSTPPRQTEPVAVAPAEAEASTDSSGRRTHVVAKGETLFAIARKYYGDGTKWPRITEANPGLKPESLSVGKSIVVP